jgi:hypothetical protein
MLTSIALTSTGLFILSVKALFSMNARRHRCRLADIAGHTYADQTEKAEQQPGDAAELQRRYQEAVYIWTGWRSSASAPWPASMPHCTNGPLRSGDVIQVRGIAARGLYVLANKLISCYNIFDGCLILPTVRLSMVREERVY